MISNNEMVIDYLSGLNDKQVEVVKHTEGPLLVLSGAGTGKTRVLTTRIVHILTEGLAEPQEILAVTFTNKAANELIDRVQRQVNSTGIWLGTFHAIGMRILRRHANLVGLTEDFIIINADEQLTLMKQVVEDLSSGDKSLVKKMTNIINGWKDKNIDVNKIDILPCRNFDDRLAQTMYKEYQARLRANNYCDFGDLLLYNMQIFKEHPEVLEYYQKLFKYILVDEYQDTNVIQYLWLKSLCALRNNICCVGDEDQSIYGWRGAEVTNILKFAEYFPESKVIRLEQNYRSTGNILAAAAALISNNKKRLGKELWTDAICGEKISLSTFLSDREESLSVASDIDKKTAAGIRPSTIAILVRTSTQTRAIEDNLVFLNIPYQVVGGMKFYERREIRDAISYLKIAFTKTDSLSFERVLNIPKRSIGAVSLRKIRDLANQKGTSQIEAARLLISSNNFRGKANGELEKFLNQIDDWHDQINYLSPEDILDKILKESGYLKMLESDNKEDSAPRLENLRELGKVLEEYDSIPQFLEHVALVMEKDSALIKEAVSVMTLHSAKGLEFDYVYLPGWIEGIFPHRRAMEEKGYEGLEEERRLAYVGITRARKKLFISYTKYSSSFYGRDYSMPSQFLQELPREIINFYSK